MDDEQDTPNLARILIGITQGALFGAYFVIMAPVWIPGTLIHLAKKLQEKPVKHHGTKRPRGGIR
jgi:hypothetical protein